MTTTESSVENTDGQVRGTHILFLGFDRKFRRNSLQNRTKSFVRKYEQGNAGNSSYFKFRNIFLLPTDYLQKSCHV